MQLLALHKAKKKETKEREEKKKMLRISNRGVVFFENCSFCNIKISSRINKQKTKLLSLSARTPSYRQQQYFSYKQKEIGIERDGFYRPFKNYNNNVSSVDSRHTDA